MTEEVEIDVDHEDVDQSTSVHHFQDVYPNTTDYSSPSPHAVLSNIENCAEDQSRNIILHVDSKAIKSDIPPPVLCASIDQSKLTPIRQGHVTNDIVFHDVGDKRSDSSTAFDLPASTVLLTPTSLVKDNQHILASPEQPSTPSALLCCSSSTNSASSKHCRDKKIMPVADNDGKTSWQCPICDKQLASDHDFTVHIRSHNASNSQEKKENTCTICDKVLSSQSSLDRHMLVHSGERPFHCKLCGMSFTTNGNMHRHSRIHAKDQQRKANKVSGSVEKPKPSKMTGKASSNSPSTSLLQTISINKSVSKDQHDCISSSTGMISWSKSKIFPDDLKTDIGIYSTATNHTAANNDSHASVSCCLAGDDITVQNFVKHEIVDNQLCALKNDSSVAKRQKGYAEVSDYQKIQKKMQLENAGWKAHTSFGNTTLTHSKCTSVNSIIEIKSDSSIDPECSSGDVVSDLSKYNCDLCKQVFTSIDKMVMHKFLVHFTNQQTEDRVAQVLAASTEAVPPVSVVSHFKVGFSDLDFMDFTSNKFPLAAKALCEDEPRRPSSDCQNYTCLHCRRAFPAYTALAIHMASYDPMNHIKCPFCECHFTVSSLIQAHMCKHVSDQVFAKLSQVDSESAGLMGKDNFLASFDLISKDFLKECVLIDDDACEISNAENDDYFSWHHIACSTELLVNQDGCKNASEVQSSLSTTKRDCSLLFDASLDVHSSTFQPKTDNVDVDIPSLVPHACKICGMSYKSIHALKVHHRCHTGTSLYQCNYCHYGSMDKKTLVRHMRRHNGHRPYRCCICDTAFTTKANCGRHIKKVHDILDLLLIEASMQVVALHLDNEKTDGYLATVTECQFCGVDFMSFGDLQHHLRTHCCHQKPFTCQICLTGFSTKANAVRHIQKLHVLSKESEIEKYISNNDLCLGLQMEDRDVKNKCRDSISVDSCKTSFSNSNMTSSPSPDKLPPMAHSTPHHSLCPITYYRFGSTPLDLSLKDLELVIHLQSMTNLNGCRSTNCNVMDLSYDDEPLDLGMKKADLSPEISSLDSKQMSSKNQMVQCPYCTDVMLDEVEANAHMIKIHQVQMSTLASSTDRNNNINVESMSLDINSETSDTLQITSTHVPLHLIHTDSQTQNADILLNVSANVSLTTMPLYSTNHQLHSIQNSASAGASDLKEMRVSSTQSISSINSVNDTSGDLASVNKIIESATSQDINAYLKHPAHISVFYNAKCLRGFDLGDNDLGQALPKTYQGLLDVAAATNEGPAVDHDHMVSFNSILMVPESVVHDKLISKHAIKMKKRSQSWTIADFESKKQDAVYHHDGRSSLVKKKRNSYADSPHKLKCRYCTRSFPWISSLNRHMLTHTGQKPFKCSRCSVTFSTKSNRERHLIRKHNVNMLDPASRQTMDRPYKCGLCVFSSFSTEGNLLKHYKERHPGNSPPQHHLLRDGDCSFEELRKGPDDLVEELSDRLQCSVATNSSIEMDESDSVNTINSSTIIREHNVVALSYPFNGEQESKSVSLKGVGSNLLITSFKGSSEAEGALDDKELCNKNPERDNYNVDKITSCWLCGQEFKSRKLLLKHIKEHNIDLPFKCYLCDASFSSRVECLFHQEERHQVAWNHLKVKNSVEDIEVFADDVDRIVEKNCSTGQFPDDVDDVSTVTPQGGEDGMDASVTSDYLQRKVFCSLCSKRFWSLQDLRRHMRSHTGERPFECDVCMKRFTLKHSMMRHRRKHCDAVNSASPTSATDDNDESEGHSQDHCSADQQTSIGDGSDINQQNLATPNLNSMSQTVTTVRQTHLEAAIADVDQSLSLKNDGGDAEDYSAVDDQCSRIDLLSGLLGMNPDDIDQMIDSKASTVISAADSKPF